MQNKRLIIILVLVLAVCIAAFTILFILTRPDTQAGVKSITVTVVHSDGSEKVFNIKTEAEYLREVLEREKLVKGIEDQYGLYIKEVDGEEAIYAVNGAYWSISVNGEYAQAGVEAIPVTEGANYELAYTK